MKMTRFRSLFTLGIAVVTLLALAGCATPSVPAVELEKSAALKTQRVALLKIPEPRNLAIVNLGGAASAFGLVGSLVQAGNNSAHTSDFIAEFDRQKRSLAQPLSETLIRGLQDSGYEVAVVDQKPKLAADGKSDDYSGVHVEADAIVSVWVVSEAYYSPPKSNSYEPMVVIKVRVLDAKTKQDLYFKTFSVGFELSLKNAVHLPADPDVRFDSFQDLMKRFDVAVAGWVSCGDAVVQYVAADLKRNARVSSGTVGSGSAVATVSFTPTGALVGTVRVHRQLTAAQIEGVLTGVFRDREWDVTERMDGHMIAHIKHRAKEAVLTAIYDGDQIQLYCEGWKIDKKTGERLQPELPESWIENVRNDLTERLAQTVPSP